MSIQTPEESFAMPSTDVLSIPRVLVDLDRLYQPADADSEVGRYMSASGGEHFSLASFGRDTEYAVLFNLHTALLNHERKLQPTDDEMIKHSFEIMVMYQGSRSSDKSEEGLRNSEEPGKIHHEARWLSKQARETGRLTPADVLMKQLIIERNNPDDDPETMISYDSVDSTPLFVRAVGDYGKVVGGEKLRQLFDAKVHNYRGETLSIGEGFLRAMDWSEAKLRQSKRGYIEYYRLPGQESAIENQVWQDSITSNVHDNAEHRDGKLANVLEPIAAIEEQALGYDAWVVAIELFEDNPDLAISYGITADKIESWRTIAEDLRQRIFKDFWLEDEQRFAQALDYDPNTHQTRKITTPTSNPFMLLNTSIFDGLSEDEREKYIAPMVEQIFSREFLTDVGIRCRAASRAGLIDFVDYHGSWAVWGWITHFIANGVRRHGIEEPADELDKRVLNSVNRSGGNFEFFLADPKTNEVHYRYKKKSDSNGDESARVLVATNIPDEPQAWEAYAVQDIKRIRRDAKMWPSGPKELPGWVRILEAKIRRQIGNFDLKHTANMATAIIDIDAGKQADQRYHDIADQQPLYPHAPL